MSLSTHITTALSHALAYADAIDLARKDAKGMTRDAVRDVILPITSAKFAVALKEGKAKGTKVLDKDAPKYEACKKATQRLLKDICGDASSGKQEEVEVPAELIEMAKKLAKLAQKYEGARSLASKAVAIAFAQ
jgi:anion-transporting  ArsA/GET3 family ATPase